MHATNSTDARRAFEQSACVAIATALTPLASALGKGSTDYATNVRQTATPLAEEASADVMPIERVARPGKLPGAADDMLAPSVKTAAFLRGQKADVLLSVVRSEAQYRAQRNFADDLKACATTTYNKQLASYANAVVLCAFELFRRSGNKADATAVNVARAAVLAGFRPARADWTDDEKVRQLIGYAQSAEKRGLLVLK